MDFTRGAQYLTHALTHKNPLFFKRGSRHLSNHRQKARETEYSETAAVYCRLEQFCAREGELQKIVTRLNINNVSWGVERETWGSTGDVGAEHS